MEMKCLEIFRKTYCESAVFSTCKLFDAIHHKTKLAATWIFLEQLWQGDAAYHSLLVAACNCHWQCHLRQEGPDCSVNFRETSRGVFVHLDLVIHLHVWRRCVCPDPLEKIVLVLSPAHLPLFDRGFEARCQQCNVELGLTSHLGLGGFTGYGSIYQDCCFSRGVESHDVHEVCLLADAASVLHRTSLQDGLVQLCQAPQA
mmetsp:Transcript_26848/g.61913  ORF Transcript_26848/g.61913 Transcript_26848/m.61913 type:complete len:201 (+) Transcript_26848:954-1556(+)